MSAFIVFSRLNRSCKRSGTKMPSRPITSKNSFFNPPNNQFLRKYFNKCMKYVKGKKIVDILNREAVEIKTRRSAVQNVMKAIRARESCLQQIMNLCNNINAEDMQQVPDQHINKASELLTHLRILSLNVVECVLRWRNYLIKLIKQCRPKANTSKIVLTYLFENENYLLKVSFFDFSYLKQKDANGHLIPEPVNICHHFQFLRDLRPVFSHGQ